MNKLCNKYFLVSLAMATIFFFFLSCTNPIQDNDIPVTSLELNYSDLTLVVGAPSQTISLEITPSDATDQNIVWSSSNTSIANVTNGIISPLAVGSTIITAESTNGKSDTCNVTVVEYSVGDTGPGGGIIIYDANDYATYTDWRYIEVAISDIIPSYWIYGSGGAPHPEVSGTLSDIGSGQNNTTLILNVENLAQSAATMCDEYTNNGITDWFLPSYEELQLVYTYYTANGLVGIDNTKVYWSSTETTGRGDGGDTEYADVVRFESGNKDEIWKSQNGLHCRPIRIF